PPRSPPAPSLSHPVVPHSRALRTRLPPAPVTPSGLSSRSPSTAASPSLYTPPVPCNPATVPANMPATLQPLRRFSIPLVVDSQTGSSLALAGSTSCHFPLFLLLATPLLTVA